jgi:hypothetical protein
MPVVLRCGLVSLGSGLVLAFLCGEEQVTIAQRIRELGPGGKDRHESGV